MHNDEERKEKVKIVKQNVKIEYSFQTENSLI